MKEWFVYIVLCEDSSFYTGVTRDLKRCFQEHVEGRGGKYTLKHKPLKVVYFEVFDTAKQALTREKQLKGWSHKKKEILVIKFKKRAA